VHPFGEGNTRTIALFIILYLKTLRFNINYLVFKEHSLYFRNALVRSNYSNKDIYPTNEYLINFFENLLSNGNHKLDNNDLYIDD
ncbi:MAG TPA: cell filamentation protein Fic, partial [Mollicutes bacterium]|nr:cell filamentation protein Fic [Mollicutes bacterium]